MCFHQVPTLLKMGFECEHLPGKNAGLICNGGGFHHQMGSEWHEAMKTDFICLYLVGGSNEIADPSPPSFKVVLHVDFLEPLMNTSDHLSMSPTLSSVDPQTNQAFHLALPPKISPFPHFSHMFSWFVALGMWTSRGAPWSSMAGR